jgi:hypothetical protein
MIRLFINSRAQSPAAALVNSPTKLQPVTFPSIVAGNKIKYRVFVVDGFGGFETYSGDNTYTLKMSLGNVLSGTTLVSQNTWAREDETIEGIATSGWGAILDCSVAGVTGYVAGLLDREAHWEFQLTNATPEIFTLIQAPVVIHNKLIA